MSTSLNRQPQEIGLAGVERWIRPAADTVSRAPRPTVRGKFIFVGDQKLFVRGVTYGPFAPDEIGCQYRTADVVEKDFAAMRAHGINAVRTYTVPPRWLLDLAQRYGLRVMVGLPWEQHITFLDSRARAREIERRLCAGVRACAGHPAVLCYVIGNEIPSQIVRWYGRRRTERFLRRLYLAAKREDPGGLVTYANYPSTEYLQLPFLDFVCFNVYLETPEKLAGYLARLQNIAGDRPLVVAETGLDVMRHGEQRQADVLDWQIRTIFGAGCAGTFVFAWTDEWYRGGSAITDWQFGLTDRDRHPRASMARVEEAFARAPFAATDTAWPKVSVVVCTYNGGRTIADCLKGISRLDYPDYEVIVVDDGSTDGAGDIASQFDVRLIRTENRGLSSARNTGMRAAAGEIVAYIDDDARPDEHWLRYLALGFMDSDHAGVGGPNIAPDGDGFWADCVAHAPGGPIHILLTDTTAEHIPGCNMAFRREALLAVGGFDEQFRIAGDDVDVCWKLQERGWTLGFSPSALVWHHRRNSLRTYWKQQKNYGKAEALLERKWPQQYNALGNPRWRGRLYGQGLLQAMGWKRWRIYHGTWGSALFQSVYHQAPGTLYALPTTPEWYMVIAVLGAVSLVGLEWTPALLAAPLMVLAALVPAAQAVGCAARAAPANSCGWGGSCCRRAVIAWLHLIQPASRLWGRIHGGLTPWRRRGAQGLVLPRARRFARWSETWCSLDDRLRALETALRHSGAVVTRGGDFDNWDLEVRGGLGGRVRLKMTVEEHGAGRQMERVKAWATYSTGAVVLGAVLALLGLLGLVLDPAFDGLSILGGAAALMIEVVMVFEASAAMAAVVRAAGGEREGQPEHIGEREGSNA